MFSGGYNRDGDPSYFWISDSAIILSNWSFILSSFLALQSSLVLIERVFVLFYLMLDYLPVFFLCLHGHCFVSWLSHHLSIEILLRVSLSCSSVSLPHWCYRTVSQKLRPVCVNCLFQIIWWLHLSYNRNSLPCMPQVVSILYSHTPNPLLRMPTRLLPRRVFPKQDLYFPHISHLSYTLFLFQQLVPIPVHLELFFSGGRNVTSNAFLDWNTLSMWYDKHYFI